MKNQIVLFFGFLTLISFCSFSQKEYSFVSLGQQKLILNPAFAGSSQGLSANTLYGGSFSISNPVVQYYLGADYGFKKGFGIGLSYTGHDYNMGLYNSNQLDLSGSYKIRLKNKITIVPSLQASYIQVGLDKSKLSFSDFENYNQTPYINSGPRPGFTGWAQDTRIILKHSNVSFSSGFIFDLNNKFTFGAAFFDLNQPDVGLFGASKRPLTQIYHISGVLFKDKTISLQPYSLIKLQQYYDQFVDAGCYTSYKWLTLQTAMHTQFGNYYYSPTKATTTNFIAGLCFNLSILKLGYTHRFSSSAFHYSSNEVYLSASFGKGPGRNTAALFIE